MHNTLKVGMAALTMLTAASTAAIAQKVFVITFAVFYPSTGDMGSDVYAWQGETWIFDSRAKCEATLVQLGNSKKGQGDRVDFQRTGNELIFYRYGGDFIKDAKWYYKCSEMNFR